MSRKKILLLGMLKKVINIKLKMDLVLMSLRLYLQMKEQDGKVLLRFLIRHLQLVFFFHYLPDRKKIVN